MVRFILSQKEFPYLLTILFVLIGWSINRVISSIVEAPTIECSLDDRHESNKSIYTYTLENISSKNRFVEIIFDVDLIFEDKADSVVYATVVSVAPSTSRSVERDFIKDYAKFSLAEFQPGWVYKFQIVTTGRANMSLSFTSKDNSILLRESSIKTFIAKHELQILTTLIFLWIVFAIAYLSYLNRYEKSE